MPRCHRSARALGTWRVTGGGVMARHWQDACVDAVAKLPPVWAPRFGERSRVELRSLVSVRSVRDATHPDSSMRWRTDAVAVSSLRPRPWDLVGVSLVDG